MLAMFDTRPSIRPVLILALVVFASSGCTKSLRKVRFSARGDSAFAAEKYDDAEIEYKNALRMVPLDPPTMGKLGQIYYKEGRLIQAYMYLQKASELLPDDGDLRLKLAMAEFPLGKVKEAREAALRMLKSEPTNEDALFLLAATSRAQKDADESQQLIEKLRAGGKDCSGYHVALGVLRLIRHDVDGAEGEFSKAVELDPKSSAAQGELGQIYASRHDMKRAGQAFKNSSDAAPLRSVFKLKYAEYLRVTGSKADATKLLDSITTGAPDYIPALIVVMKVAFEERRFDDCAATIGKILARDSGNYEALSQRGALRLTKGDVDGAIADLEKLDGVYRRVPQLKYELALAYLRKGDKTKAEDKLNQDVLIAPDFDPALLLLAELNVRKGNPAAAVDSLTQLLKKKPQVGRAYLLLAQAFLAEKKPEEALAVYQRLREIAPKDPQIPYLEGMVERDMKQPAEARKFFEESVAVAPEFAAAQEMLVNMDLSEMRYSEATDLVQGLVKRYPKSAGPWVLMEKIHLAGHDLKAAEADLLKAIDVDPKFQPSYLLLSRIYVSTNRQQEALTKLTALADKTNNENALYQIALIHYELKQYDQARAAYERLLGVNPHSLPALNNLAYLYSDQLHQLDKALEYAKRARESFSDSVQAADTLGWVLFKRGEYHNALTLIQEAAEKEPSEHGIQFHLGMTHYMLGEEVPARLALQQAVSLAPESPDKEEAKRRLAVLDIDPYTAGPTVQADLESRVHADPNDPVARVRLAAIQGRKGGSSDAAAGFEAALKLKPNDVALMLELVKLYTGSLHNPARARELARNAHENAPDDPKISALLGHLLYQTGDYAWALDLLQQAARGLPDQPELAFDLARSNYSVGRVAEAQAGLKGLSQGSAPAALSASAGHLASMISAAKGPAEAQAALGEAKKILEADPGDIPATLVMALSDESQGNFQEAQRLYEKVSPDNAPFAPVVRRLALLYTRRLSDDKRALDLVNRARAAFPDDPELSGALGALDYRKADYSAAARLLQESLRARGDDAETLYYLGMTHYQLKDVSDSQDELKRALDLKLSGAEAGEAMRAMDEMNGTSKAPSLSDIPTN